MRRLWLALALSGLAFPACSGVEELALNPEGHAVAGTASQMQSSSAGQSAQGGSAGSSVHPVTTGGTSQGGQTAAQAGSAAVLCSGDASCTSATAPHCRADGRCVACLIDDDCGNEELHCDVPSGACAVGAPSDGNGGGDAAGGDSATP